MKFKIERASDYGIPLDFERIYDDIEFKTIEELMKFISENGKVIIYPDNKIIIYDDYME